MNIKELINQLDILSNLNKIELSTFYITLDILFTINNLDIRFSDNPEIITESKEKLILSFKNKDKEVYFYIGIYNKNTRDFWHINRYDHKDGYKQNLELNEELFEWLWTT